MALQYHLYFTNTNHCVGDKIPLIFTSDENQKMSQQSLDNR